MPSGSKVSDLVEALAGELAALRKGRVGVA
jgi:hypothetical protein